MHNQDGTTGLAGHKHSLDPVARKQELLREGPLAVLHGLLDKVVDTYREIDDEVADDLRRIERDVFGGGNRTQSTTIYRLKREVLEFRRAALPLRVPLDTLADDDGMVASHELRLHFRDVADHLTTATDLIAEYDERLTTLLNAAATKVSIQQNRDMRKISSWAAIAAVPTAIAGIYGMNFDYMPELHYKASYPILILLMVSACILLWRTLRRNHWL